MAPTMKQALNLGCGTSPLREDAVQWFNVDKSQPKELNGATFILADLESPPLPFSDDTFDLALASHSLEHVKNLLPLVEDVWRVLKPGGKFLIRVPYAFSHGAWEDPTHVRAFVPGTFHSFTQEYYWRADYGYRGDFAVDESIMLLDTSLEGMPEDELLEWAQKSIGACQELLGTLTCIKPIRKHPLPRPQVNVKFSFLRASSDGNPDQTNG